MGITWNDQEEYHGVDVSPLTDLGAGNRAATADAIDHWGAQHQHAPLENSHGDQFDGDHNSWSWLMGNVRAAKNVSSMYDNYVDGEAPGSVEKNNEVVDLSTPEARIAALGHLTQNTEFGSHDVESQNDCAASSFVAAAIVGGGTEGLLKLMEGMANDPLADEAFKKKLGGEGGDLSQLREKIAKGEAITVDDIHHLQRDLNKELLQDDHSLGKGDGKTLNQGVSHDAQQMFLNNSFGLHAMMIENHLGLDGVDTDGNYSPNHAVLQIGDKAIYDPYMRNEGQLVTQSDELRDYALLTRNKVR